MNTAIQRPSLLLTLLEVRAPFEVGAHFLSRRIYEKRLPKGKGRPVLVIPGFGAGDLSTVVLRQTLSRLGYEPVGWGMGRNMGATRENRAHLVDEIKRLYSLSQQKVSIVGWSLGGIYARELGRNYPMYVHSVVSMGSPLGGDPTANVFHGLFKRGAGKDYTEEDLAAFNRRSMPPGVRTVAIHSKSDGVVAWQCSLEQDSDLTENVEVFSSHCGLVFSPLALSALARALQ